MSGRPYLKKTIRSRQIPHVPVRVKVFRDEETYHEYCRRDGFYDKDSAGLCFSVERCKFDGPVEGEPRNEVEVYLIHKYVGGGYVSHEMLHAALKLRRLMKTGSRSEERLCLILQDLVYGFWRWWQQLMEGEE